MPDKPQLENAPGHVLRECNDGWTVFWQARTNLVRRGFRPARQRITMIGAELTDAERALISDRCNGLQDEMLVWGRGGLPANPVFDGTIGSLIRCYQTDPDSPFRKLRFESRGGYRRFFSRIDADHGREFVSEIRGRQVLRWHEDWTPRGVAMAHGLIGMLRTILTFGATILDDADCRAAKALLHDMKFPMPKPRNAILTLAQVNAVRAKAHEWGFHSIALANAFQFDGMLRPRDVVGEWVPQSEPGISDVLWHGRKWLRGLRWEEIDDSLILRHVTSKRQKEIEIDLKLAPLVIEELARFGSPLPKHGPIIVSEESGRPYLNDSFSRYWRKIARAAGIPDHIRNMDSRAGAISEATDAGAELELIRHAATHSDISMTQRYSRGGTEKTAEVMQRRIEYRNKAERK